MERIVLFDPSETLQIIRQMAHTLYGLIASHERVAVVGLLRRGSPLADLLCNELKLSGFSRDICRIDLDVKRYADDLTILYPKTLLTINEAQTSVNFAGQAVVLVDDVLFTGNTMLTILEHIKTKGAENVLIACLVDRHATKLPIHADVVGIHMQVSPHSIVECNIPPYEPLLKIVLASPSR